jgi:hypothetical protein
MKIRLGVSYHKMWGATVRRGADRFASKSSISILANEEGYLCQILKRFMSVYRGFVKFSKRRGLDSN